MAKITCVAALHSANKSPFSPVFSTHSFCADLEAAESRPTYGNCGEFAVIKFGLTNLLQMWTLISITLLTIIFHDHFAGAGKVMRR